MDLGTTHFDARVVSPLAGNGLPGVFLEVQARLGKLHARSQADDFNIIDDVDAGLLLLVPIELPPSLTVLVERVRLGQDYLIPSSSEQQANASPPALNTV